MGTAVAFGVVDQLVRTVKLAAGKIDGEEYGKRTAENLGSTGGGLGGACLGALIGSALLPGIGTALGGGIGGFLGGLFGGSAGRGLLSRAWQSRSHRPPAQQACVPVTL